MRRLYAGALAAEIDAHHRATTLAIVAMARHALLLDGRPQLDEPHDIRVPRVQPEVAGLRKL